MLLAPWNRKHDLKWVKQTRERIISYKKISNIWQSSGLVESVVQRCHQGFRFFFVSLPYTTSVSSCSPHGCKMTLDAFHSSLGFSQSDYQPWITCLPLNQRPSLGNAISWMTDQALKWSVCWGVIQFMCAACFQPRPLINGGPFTSDSGIAFRRWRTFKGHVKCLWHSVVPCVCTSTSS